MKNVLKIFSIVLVLGLATKAHAGILIEPFLGYELSSESKLDLGGVDVGGKTSGVVMGARLGYKLPAMIWFAADYSLMSGGSFKGNTIDGKIDRSNLYIDVGVDLPILLRVWGGVGIMNSTKYKYDTGADVTLKNGSNMKFGVGLTMLPFVRLNVEYFIHDYKDYDSAVGSGSTSSVYNSHKESGAQLSVSLPLNL